MALLSPLEIDAAHRRIAPHLHRTPLLESARLNDWLGSRVLFKAENLQRIGAFKARGALNTLLKLQERGALPEHVVAYSSGNHAQGVALAAAKLGLRSTIYMNRDVSGIKQQATRSYGAEVVLTESRKEAEDLAAEQQQRGAFFLHPYDHDDIICGQGTACYEALKDGPAFDAVFAPVGGGGLVSGTWLAAQLVSPRTEVWGAEPLTGNDAARSLREGKIFAWDNSPYTIADGVRTLAVSERTFQYIRKLHGIAEVEESTIRYWTQWLTHLLKTTLEPSAVLGMAAAFDWLKQRGAPGSNVCVILSGGNLDAQARRTVWADEQLVCEPKI